jgi:hypothetical protein
MTIWLTQIEEDHEGIYQRPVQAAVSPDSYNTKISNELAME